MTYLMSHIQLQNQLNKCFLSTNIEASIKLSSWTRDKIYHFAYEIFVILDPILLDIFLTYIICYQSNPPKILSKVDSETGLATPNQPKYKILSVGPAVFSKCIPFTDPQKSKDHGVSFPNRSSERNLEPGYETNAKEKRY